MPLTQFQTAVIGVLHQFRTPHDYVGGGAALNFDELRLSDDMDMFQDRTDALPAGVRKELDALRARGFAVEVLYTNDDMAEAIVRRDGSETRVQWFGDAETRRRFLAVVEHEVLGFALHKSDNAVNKTLCASRRNRAARDAVDLVILAEGYCPLGPLVWAAAGKDTSQNPLQVIRGIRKNALGYSDEEIQSVRMDKGAVMTRDQVRKVLGPALDRAAEYCEGVAPIDFQGHLFVDKTLIPGEATEVDLQEKRYEALPLKDFS